MLHDQYVFYSMQKKKFSHDRDCRLWEWYCRGVIARFETFVSVYGQGKIEIFNDVAKGILKYTFSILLIKARLIFASNNKDYCVKY